MTKTTQPRNLHTLDPSRRHSLVSARWRITGGTAKLQSYKMQLIDTTESHSIKNWRLPTVRGSGSAPVKSLDGHTLTDHNKTLERWIEHFKSVLIQKSYFWRASAFWNSTKASRIPSGWEAYNRWDSKGHKSYVSREGLGIDGIPAEVIKLCSSSLLPHLS